MKTVDMSQGGAAHAATAYRIAINVNSSGANVLVAGTAGRIILVMSYVLVSAVDNTIDFEDSDGGVLGGPMQLLAQGGIAAPYCQMGHFKLPAGKGLSLGLTVGAQVGGHLAYALI